MKFGKVWTCIVLMLSKSTTAIKVEYFSAHCILCGFRSTFDDHQQCY